MANLWPPTPVFVSSASQNDPNNFVTNLHMHNLNRSDPDSSFGLDFFPEGWDSLISAELAALERSTTRVCERCIAKKIKCDLNRPVCSRCRETGSECVYSSIKRKRGPAKGSRRGQGRRLGSRVHDTSSSVPPPSQREAAANADVGGAYTKPPGSSEATSVTPESALSYLSPTLVSELSTLPIAGNASQTWPSAILEGGTTVNRCTPRTTGSGVFPAKQLDMLIQNFFVHLHPSVPLFNELRFLQQYRCGALSYDLITAVCAVSAKVIGNCRVWSPEAADSYIGELLESNVVDQTPAAQVSLDEFRQAVLLAFYELYERPGERSLGRVARLTRKAYQCGIHQLDNPDQCASFRHAQIGDEDAEDWRAVWWSIYSLDTFSNILASTPFLVEKESIKTALMSTFSGPVSAPYSRLEHPERVFLPPDCSSLPSFIKAITIQSDGAKHRIRMAAITILREAATLRRLLVQNPSQHLRKQIAAVECQLIAMHDALPPSYTNPAPSTAENESIVARFDRLTSVLFIQFACIVTMIPSGFHNDDGEWWYRWRRTIALCQDAVMIAQQWDCSLSLIDPLVGAVFSGIIRLLDLHGRLSTMAKEDQERVDAWKLKLEFLLHKSVPSWHLSRHILSSSEKFTQLAAEQLTPQDVNSNMAIFPGPLHTNALCLL